MDDAFDPRLYGARWAAVYDEWHAGMMDDEGAVAALRELAGDGGSVLEFGVGTGRLAVPLAARGVDVVGVDISEEIGSGDHPANTGHDRCFGTFAPEYGRQRPETVILMAWPDIAFFRPRC